jgi:magnesium transporter
MVKKKRRTHKNVIPSKKEYIGRHDINEVKGQLYQYANHGLIKQDDNIDLTNLTIETNTEYNTWFNIHGLHNETVIESIGQRFSLDSLVIQNILDTTIRPKIQLYENYIFFTVKSISSNKLLQPFEQISFVLGKDVLLSFQEKRGDHFQHIRQRITSNLGIVCQMKHDFLLYLLLEAVLDGYYELLDETLQQIQNYTYQYLEKELKDFSVETIENLKIQLNQIKRSLSPIREFLMNIEKLEHPVLQRENSKYFIDLKDHVNILLEDVDYQTKQLETVTNVYFSLQSQKMNEIMKTLTVISSIFIPITFIAGVYGMNFQHMPELSWSNGYYIALSLMLLVIIAMLFYFKRKNWF